MDISRVPLASLDLDPAPLAHVRVVRLEFEPGQATGLHLHPMPVLGYVAEGAFLVQPEGEEARRYRAGEVVLEPAGKRMLRFDNASTDQPAVLIATYLGGGERLIEFLPH
jgi:quercetin dioxygenase-like cupin family protein